MLEFIKNIFKKKGNNEMNKTKNKEMPRKEIEVLISDFISGKTLRDMNIAYNYYLGNQDILNRKIYGFDRNGDKIEIPFAPNNKVVDNLYRRFLDQKVNYLLSKEPTFVSENDEYNKLIKDVFDDEFLKTLFLLGKNAYKYGLSWLYVYYDKDSKLNFKIFDSREIIPIWVDNDHKELDKVIRIFKTKKFNGNAYEDVTNVELYTTDGIKRYTYDNGKLSDVLSDEPYMILDNKAYNWAKLPIIPFKVDETEQPLINRMKTLQDNINLTISDLRNELSNTNYNKILVLKEYDGEPMSFRRNLNTAGFIKVARDGGVETLDMEINIEKYKGTLEELRNSLISNAKGFDTKNDRLGSNPNTTNIKVMYTDIDLDSNGIEREFKTSIKKLLWFINQHYMLLGKGNFEDVELDIVFNKDILINENEAIEECIKSLSVLSKKTVISQHPWVTDVDLEIKQIKEEMETTDDYDDYIPKPKQTDKENETKDGE